MPDALTPEQLAEREAALTRRETEFAASVKAGREATNAGLVNMLVASGRLLPADAPAATLIFNALDDEPLEFTAGEAKRSASSELAALLGKGAKLAPVNETRTSPTGEFTATDANDAKAIERGARKLMATDANLSFEAAVEAVTAQQGA